MEEFNERTGREINDRLKDWRPTIEVSFNYKSKLVRTGNSMHNFKSPFQPLKPNQDHGRASQLGLCLDRFIEHSGDCSPWIKLNLPSTLFAPKSVDTCYEVL